MKKSGFKMKASPVKKIGGALNLAGSGLDLIKGIGGALDTFGSLQDIFGSKKKKEKKN